MSYGLKDDQVFNSGQAKFKAAHCKQSASCDSLLLEGQ